MPPNPPPQTSALATALSDLRGESRRQHLERLAGPERQAVGQAGRLTEQLELACHYSGHVGCADAAQRAANLFAVGYQIADDLEDVDSDLARGRLNYVGLLRDDHDAEASFRIARERSLELLGEAATLADSLPLGAGEALSMLAAGLAAKV